MFALNNPKTKKISMPLPPRRWWARSPFGIPGVGASPRSAPHRWPPCPLTARFRLFGNFPVGLTLRKGLKSKIEPQKQRKGARPKIPNQTENYHACCAGRHRPRLPGIIKGGDTGDGISRQHADGLGHCHADVRLTISDLDRQSHPANKTQEEAQKKVSNFTSPMPRPTRKKEVRRLRSSVHSILHGRGHRRFGPGDESARGAQEDHAAVGLLNHMNGKTMQQKENSSQNL